MTASPLTSAKPVSYAPSMAHAHPGIAHRLIFLSILTASICVRGHLAAAPSWNAQIQPLLDTHCVKCHGPIEQKAGLELDHLAALLKGGESGPVVKPGNPEASPLYTVLAEGSDPHMPPKKQLNASDRASIREWISSLSSESPRTTAPEKIVPREFPDIQTAINTLIEEEWKRRSITPARPLDDVAWLRRASLDIAGRIPTQEETDDFQSSTSQTKRAKAVQRLLASPDYATRMRELWDNFLMGRPKRGSSEDRRKQNGWYAFLERCFQTDQPWHHTVHQILTGRADRPETKGSTWFLYERKNDHQAIAEAVGPLIYGTRIDCAQCHDHPLAREIKQSHYWGLVTAFNRSKNIEGSNGVAESAIGGFVNFTNLKKESQPAVITLLNGRTLTETWPAGDQKPEDKDDLYIDAKAKVRVPFYSRREAFADVATEDNFLLAKAFVNRMWATLLGRGIVHPADEMNARNVPSHPELLEWLAKDFASNGHRIKRLIEGIVLSTPYSLAGGDPKDPSTFAAAPERPLTAEQLARSWRIVVGLPPDHDPLRKAAVAAIPDVLPKDYNANFVQAQFLANSPLIRDLLNPENPTINRLEKISDTNECVTETFKVTLGRPPDPAEKQRFTEFLQPSSSSPTDRLAALQTILHAIITSPEFLIVPR